jgi:hypothetical protein
MPACRTPSTRRTPHSRRPVSGGVAFAVVIAVGFVSPWVAAVIPGLWLAVLIGVVMPSVWSRRAARRRAALRTLRELRRWLR